MRGLFVSWALFIFLFGSSSVFAYSDPASLPPNNDTEPPLNIGPLRQRKFGDLEVNDFKSRGGIELGGVFKNSWLGIGGGCNWQGTLCDCKSAASSIGNISLTLGWTCAEGRLIDQRIVRFDFSSRITTCDTNAPSDCSAGYNYYNEKEEVGGFLGTVEAAITFVVNIFERIFNWFSSWF